MLREEVVTMFTAVDAALLARVSHEGQVDKANVPYFRHVEGVASLLTVFGDEELVIAAYLHDIVEDTDGTLDDLRAAGVPERAIQVVDALTRRDETYAEFVARVSTDRDAALVKLADNFHNSLPSRVAAAGTNGKLLQRYINARSVLFDAVGVEVFAALRDATFEVFGEYPVGLDEPSF